MYDGAERVVEPHCHGLGPSGKELIRAYQLRPQLAAEPHPWRLFDLARVTEAEVLELTFDSSRPGYNPVDQKMDSVHCHL